jgi:hypothetical protein
MVFSASLVDVGIAFLLAVAFAEWSKVRRKSEKGFGWIAAAGVFFLFAGTLNAAILPNLFDYVANLYLETIFAAIGWILALIGTLFIGYETLLEK